MPNRRAEALRRPNAYPESLVKSFAPRGYSKSRFLPLDRMTSLLWNEDQLILESCLIALLE